ncbi:uncharacterized protein BJ171DRAFT_505486 [Polychytrium aggregatum]|uniref:uncharacterized protein n=1 Tax=Polychytrium aggregatum TaxID=110093 RepID=UPI0022FF4127|nr:uncharacterized protein BJ171DRAFT_505486 [Polychytrium aggregatum]KAI9204323.1 hypothetical protein BJ171DRAFT_505486 [Polychytrium aggregatum]
MLLSLLNYWSAFPIEWMFFLYFTITIFVQAYNLGAPVFMILVTVVSLADIIIYALVPFKATSFASSFIIHSFLVYGMHGFGLSPTASNVRGWLLLAMMVSIRLSTWDPWSIQSPSSFVQLIAAHSTGFGSCYFAWKLTFLIYKRFDRISFFFGVIVPNPPFLTIKDITDSTFKMVWSPAPAQPFGVSLSKYLIDVNGVIIGESPINGENCAIVMGLSPDTKYRVRMWAVGERRVKASSAPVLVRTTILATSSQAPGEAAPKIAQQTEETSAPQPSEGTVSTSGKSEANHADDALLNQLIEQLQSELEILQRQQLELEKTVQETEEQYRQEEETLKIEIVRLKEARKLNDFPRQEQKARLKQMEDVKKELDGQYARLEKHLGRESESMQGVVQMANYRKEELASLESELRTLERQHHLAQTELSRERMEVEAELSRRRDELHKAKQITDQEERDAAATKKRLSERESLLEKLESEVKTICTLSSNYEKRKKLIEKEQEQVYDEFVVLQEEFRDLQHQLRVETKSKMTLLEQLTRSRREAMELRSRSGGVSGRNYYSEADGEDQSKKVSARSPEPAKDYYSDYRSFSSPRTANRYSAHHPMTPLQPFGGTSSAFARAAPSWSPSTGAAPFGSDSSSHFDPSKWTTVSMPTNVDEPLLDAPSIAGSERRSHRGALEGQSSPDAVSGTVQHPEPNKDNVFTSEAKPLLHVVAPPPARPGSTRSQGETDQSQPSLAHARSLHGSLLFGHHFYGDSGSLPPPVSPANGARGLFGSIREPGRYEDMVLMKNALNGKSTMTVSDGELWEPKPPLGLGRVFLSGTSQGSAGSAAMEGSSSVGAPSSWYGRTGTSHTRAVGSGRVTAQVSDQSLHSRYKGGPEPSSTRKSFVGLGGFFDPTWSDR